jgi:hypothetical protein
MNEVQTATYTRKVAAAQRALAAGFTSFSAQKDATTCLAYAYDEVKRSIGDALHTVPKAERGAEWDALYFDVLPMDLHHWNAARSARLLAAVPSVAADCEAAAALLALRNAIKAAPVVKPETKKAATEKKIAEIKEAVAAGVASPIALAIAPLRKEAADNARDWAVRSAASAKTKLEAARFDIDALVPAPGRNASKAERAMTAEARAHYFQFLKAWSASRTSYVWDEAAAQRYVEQTVRETEASFDAFVLKLDGKVGAHAAAVLVSGATWTYSILRVTLADGTVQDWKTQRITNCSVLGKLFNQWPTRIVK